MGTKWRWKGTKIFPFRHILAIRNRHFAVEIEICQKSQATATNTLLFALAKAADCSPQHLRVQTPLGTGVAERRAQNACLRIASNTAERRRRVCLRCRVFVLPYLCAAVSLCCRDLQESKILRGHKRLLLASSLQHQCATHSFVNSVFSVTFRRMELRRDHSSLALASQADACRAETRQAEP